MREKFEAIKSELLHFAIRETKVFLDKHPDQAFYAFAFACNADYGEVILSFNTEEAFNAILEECKNGPNAKAYESVERVQELKYNSGNWKYQDFASIYLFNETEKAEFLQSLPDDDYKFWRAFVEELMILFSTTMLEFSKTKVFSDIPKTDDFKYFCANHDETIQEAVERLERIKAE